MPRTGLWLRIFVALVVAVLPPLLFLTGALLLTNTVFSDADPNVVAVLVVVAAMAWAAVLGIVYTRILSEDLRSFLSLVERGERKAPTEAVAAYDQLASSLAERNQQVAALARQTSLVPIDETPARVIGAVLSAVRSVMGDTTWQFAVLSSDQPNLLPPGVHHPPEEGRDPDPVGDLEQWASVSTGGAPVAHAEGPWGAFVIIAISGSDLLRAVLYAPWEGRRPPSRAEMDLLTLVGQHALTAVEHSLLYAQVRHQAEELDRLARIQADFLRGVTHDLQTPLTSIAALATELRAGRELSSEARDDLETIAHQAERLRRMVSQLLVASRLDVGAVIPRQEVFAPQPLIERTWAALRAERPFTLQVRGEPHLLVADPDRTEQVLWALLDNAVKYSPAGSPIEVSVEPEEADSLAISVIDHGSGMDSETQQHAFDQFYRAQRARSLAPDGSGVGLYAARGLIEAMGGSIRIDTKLGAGAVVSVRLPAERVAADAQDLRTGAGDPFAS